MPRRPNLTATYDLGERFRTQCLTGTSSLIWPAENPWTSEVLHELWIAFGEHPDDGDRTFLAKLKDQLAGCSIKAIQVAIDILAFYLLYPDKFGSDQKLALLKTVISWREWDNQPNLDQIQRAFAEGGIGFPGAFYNTGRPFHFAYLIQLARISLADPIESDEPQAWSRRADEALHHVEMNVTLMRNVTLHLILPQFFERVASPNHKRAIVEHYARYTTPGDDIDVQLANIRRGLERERPRDDLDFYDSDIGNEWRIDSPTTDESVERSVWVEKTIVAGRPDRLAGDYSLGKALWSPARAQGGADMYRFMRDVKPGDVVLHLTDNAGFSGISEAVSEAEEFNGVPNTAWADRPSYLIRLGSFKTLDPPLGRQVFLQGDFKERMMTLLREGLRNTFFGRDGNLSQGAYITPAPPELLTVLNEAYRSVSGRDLVPDAETGSEEVSGTDMPVEMSPEIHVSDDLVAIHKSFSQNLRDAKFVFGARHDQVTRSFLVSLATKPFVILTGLSGSGKTQVALQFGRWLGPERFHVAAVRPDWTGAESLFGYEDALGSESEGRRAWNVPSTLEFMLRAASDPDNAYLLVLDEMNLAHVERYFADALSGMESRIPCLPNLVKKGNSWYRSDKTPQLCLPDNLFVVGTVNVDETTYMFSPKVLDRANTLEFRVQTEELIGEATKPKSIATGNVEYTRGFLKIARDSNYHLKYPHSELESIRTALLALHRHLTESGFEFGHRVYYEVIRFCAIYQRSGVPFWQEAIDLQILQKVLPKLHGSRRRLEPALLTIAKFCLDPTSLPGQSTEPFDPFSLGDRLPSLPRSFDKVSRLIKTVRANQFASFTE